MSNYNIKDDFYDILSSKYEEAINNGHILFNGDSAVDEIEHIKVGNSTVDIQTTLLKSLMHRPEQGSEKSNPFAKPEPELTIVEKFGAKDEFRLVFNKFPVVPKHFMLITREFKSQNSPLTGTELLSTYNILLQLRKLKPTEDWFAFYNCGPESGASQPHKHIQFMTLPPSQNFKAYSDILSSTSHAFIPNVREEPLQNSDLPFAHFVARLPGQSEDITEDDLSLYFVSLLQRSLTVSREHKQDHISYNFIFTPQYMLMVPRSSGKYKDKLGINSCGVQGLLLCKNEELLELVKTDGALSILEKVGFPNTSGKASNEYDY
ncbi:5',5'''-P-1,P-4-tetraphosphate phosphorylase [Spathaspora passalidarum NRRL Y-27907]|uniref:5',5'''-P-1,P-4-tetraphosphate phosphorylase n=1 Tax=Spathaspora passalidarum (strain NRRL Y-27907 / 11-Y1) TaxID=619300 RepID=G3AUM6_SPAPN|nr:5',5'''-P-1,P-4-tetraphosphate phosphorylase [Spathaspora passalidarum NRRL Y-27907]EGW30582.1 5',5'''-P-1,P-4-tetraphosphate phosphorylase [Spathaspora passalidarum NRRL Y-27907]